MARIEILAPVGSEEMLRAAVFSGADAVYLGFSGFNARTGAGNFDADSLQEAVRFCHARGVAVHVALNTTVYGTELPALEQAIRAVAASGADAVICQDLAVATLIGKIAPQLPRHGSTQMSVHTLQGALELKELGFTRVVLARELSLPEVEHITKHCGIETECFIHGALCMSVSGQCYMSAFLGGRSGNRGSCAGPCRLPFEANALPEGKPGRLHHLSLKDNSAIDKLDKLQAIGVASAKIEGRLRTPEYVAAAVSACLAGREGRAYDRDLLKNAFSRSGFTSGYLDGKIDGTMFGVRSEADAELTKKTLPALRELYRRERSRVPVEMKIEIEEGGEKLTVTPTLSGEGSDGLSVAAGEVTLDAGSGVARMAVTGTPTTFGEVLFKVAVELGDKSFGPYEVKSETANRMAAPTGLYVFRADSHEIIMEWDNDHSTVRTRKWAWQLLDSDADDAGVVREFTYEVNSNDDKNPKYVYNRFIIGALDPGTTYYFRVKRCPSEGVADDAGKIDSKWTELCRRRLNRRCRPTPYSSRISAIWLTAATTSIRRLQAV